MAIEKAFEKLNGPSAIFDPIPSYNGDWIFTIDNLKSNARKENGKNLFEEFYMATYGKPLIEIFGTPRILDLPVGMISKPHSNGIGRCLKYSKIDFFISLTGFLNHDLDCYKMTEEEHAAYINEFIKHLKLDNEELNAFYSEKLKIKSDRLKDLMDNEINSEYFEVAMKDYAPYKDIMNFSMYINKMYDVTLKFHQGLLKLGDFLDKDVSFEELSKAFNPDIFYLLFAKIIYEFNLIRERETGHLDNSYGYLYTYLDACREVVKDNKKYNPKIPFITPKGQRTVVSRWQMKLDIESLMKRHPEAKAIHLPSLDNDNVEKYKDISLMEKITLLYNEETKVNWEFLPEGERIVKSNNVAVDNSSNNKERKDSNELINEINMRIDIMNNSGYIGTPIKGLDTFSGYYAFIYPTGCVILEKFWENEQTKTPAVDCATYVMNIDNFITMSKISKTTLIEYMKTLPEIGVKRIFHTTINNWQRNLYNAINGMYRLEDAIDFINSIKNEVLANG